MLDRIGTVSFQRTLTAAMKQNQGSLAKTQLQLATGKKATIYRDMGTATMATLSARSMLARENAYESTSTGVKQALDRYDHSLSHIYGAVEELYNALGNALAMGEARGLDTLKADTFGVLRQTMNVNQSGEFIFGGGRSDTAPFVPNSLDELVALPEVEDGFVNADLRASARVSDGTDMTYGLTASEIGLDAAKALKALHEMGPLEGKLSDAQMGQLSELYAQVKSVMSGITDVQAANGQRMQQIDTYIERAGAREIQLKTFIGEQEDADVLEVSTRLVNDQLALQASYEAFAQIREMSLINFLR